MSIQDKQEKDLFNKISYNYAFKDIYKPTQLARKFMIESLIQRLKKVNYNKGSILEIGCGHGANANYLKQIYTNYTGIDFSKELIKIANELYAGNNTKYECINIKDYKGNTNRKFDLILSVGVLHHIDNPNKIFKSIKNVSHSKTLVAFFEPQGANPVLGLLRYIRKKVDYNYSSNQVFYKKKELVKLLADAGFDILDVFYQGYFSPPFAQIPLKPKFIFMPVTLFSIWLDKIWQKLFNSLLAWNIIVILKVNNNQT